MNYHNVVHAYGTDDHIHPTSAGDPDAAVVKRISKAPCTWCGGGGLTSFGVNDDHDVVHGYGTNDHKMKPGPIYQIHIHVVAICSHLV